MKDIKYENGHLVLKDGDFALVDGVDRIKQHIITALHILKGDWFLDYRAGIDYFNNMKAYPKILKAEIKQAIQDVDGVENVKNYQFKKVGDKYKISADVIVDNQQFHISEVYGL